MELALKIKRTIYNAHLVMRNTIPEKKYQNHKYMKVG